MDAVSYQFMLMIWIGWEMNIIKKNTQKPVRCCYGGWFKINHKNVYLSVSSSEDKIGKVVPVLN
jgi:hypothetical protein